MLNYFCDTREVIYVVASCLDRCLLNFTARKFRSVIIIMKILKVLRFDTNFLLDNTFWTSICPNVEFTRPWNLRNVARPHFRKLGFHFTAPIRTAFENCSVLDSKDNFVAFKSVSL